MSSSLRRLYEDLRSISVTVVYPPGEDRDVVVQQLQRIGCRLKVVWPFPAEPPAGVDVILFQVSQDLEGRSAWNASAVDAAFVALSDYESPTTLKLLLDTRAHGVITKPFRSSGILSTLVLARASQGFQQRQQGKIEKLESTIKSRRQIEKAIRVLVDYQRMTETQAYEHMRERATGLRVTVAEVAAMLLEAHEAMEKLGFATAKPASGK
ncbi:ANTAR domain-containing response regulator [Hylemonella gracilis]|uniref:Response regulator receiver/ANTAR domain-containing protein 2 n=1 Tax=Hylemonella gracilis ATCC 19624 TaxID=887062 RepID=F3KUV1_9BURK|nr:ANTAR domain-containing protein [Hylemonella gracilis]EGI76444.1 response regulator receiver/ANTAR domain-containing protein 2 [Hylemonella gracilis ATCC 19624]